MVEDEGDPHRCMDGGLAEAPAPDPGLGLGVAGG